MNPAYSSKCVERSLLSKISCYYDAARPNTTYTCSKRCLLRLGEWMSLAVTSPRVPTLENRPPLLPPVEDQGTFGKLNAVLCERLRICLGRKPSAQREHRRVPVGQDYWRNAHAILLLASGQDVRDHYAPIT
jgi:hypothetical protein